MEDNETKSIGEIAPTSVLIPIADCDAELECEEFQEGDYGFEGHNDSEDEMGIDQDEGEERLTDTQLQQQQKSE